MKKTVILFLGLTLALSACSFTQLSKSDLTIEEAQAKAEDFINNNLMLPGTTASVKSIEEDGNFYKLVIDIGTQDVDSYISKDGKKFLPQIIDIAEFEQEVAAQAQTQTQTQEEAVTVAANYSEADKTEIGKFIDCLASKNVKIYGANWCGYTKKFVVDTIGGFDVAAPIYVECTEEVDTCNSEGVTGYPTTKINGVVYNGARSFEGLAEATGCPAPQVTVIESSNSAAASCSQ